MSACYVYVLNEGETLEKSGGLPVVMLSNSQSGDTLMRKDSGTYYLNIQETNGNCSIEIQELQ